jgi:hypothetical protein
VIHTAAFEYKGVPLEVRGEYDTEYGWGDADILVGGASIWELLDRKTMDAIIDRAEEIIREGAE